MFRYANRDVCPACRHGIDRTRPTCATCEVALLGPPAREVFAALQQVDRLVAALPSGATVVAHPEPSRPPAPAVRPVAASRAALDAASVPRILLGLGALCLLVASIVFLVVAWAALGVGGRTGVLAGFTGVAAALMAWVSHRGLRAGAESFAAVVLGLLAIDLAGAREAGWLGAMDDPRFMVVAGTAVTVVGAGIATWVRRTQLPTLVAAEAGTVLGVGTLAFGVATLPGGIEPDATALLSATLVCAAAAVVARLLRLDVVVLGARIETALAWLVLAANATDRLTPPTVEHVWLDLAVWPSLAAVVLAAVVATQTYLPMWSRVTAAAAASVVGVHAVTVVTYDESATTLALVELGVVAVGAAVVALLPSRTWGWAAAVPSVIAALALTASVLLMVVTCFEAVQPTGVWVSGVMDRIPAPDIPWSWPLLLPAGVAGASVCAGTILACRGEDPRTAILPGVSLLTAGAALVPPLYGAPLGVVVAGMLLAAITLGAAAFLTGSTWPGATAAAVVAAALVTGLANEWTTAAVLALVLVAALVAERLPGLVVSAVGLVLAPAAAAGLIWTVGEIVGLPEVWQALPVVILLGVRVVHRPGTEREVLHALVAGLAVAGSVVDGVTLVATWLAVYLTIAGVVATGSALLHPSRRRLAPVGLAFFAAAHWVRLVDLGVDTVEAYTLPLAVVLLVAGCVALILRTDSSVRALGPGLALALVPTLLLVLAEPVGLRAVLLGLACLALVAIGVYANLAAPLAAGAIVGAIVVLRQGTLAEVLPQWAIIGLVGIGLTIVGITWEQRLRELRRASAYVRGLR